MSGVGSVLRIEAEVGLLLAAGFGLIAAAHGLAVLAGSRTRLSTWLRVARLAVVASLLLPPALRLVPAHVLLPAPLRPSLGVPTSIGSRLPGGERPRPAGSRAGERDGTSPGAVVLGLGGLLAAGALVRLAATRRDLRRMAGRLRALPVVRRIGRATVATCAVTATPYAVWSRGRAWVVVPTGLVADWRRLRWLVAHELQHHRQRDTRWVYLWHAVEAVQFWNPAVYLWRRFLGGLQELACDEAVASRPGVSAAAYARCLLWAAAGAAGTRRLRVALPAASSPSVLRRRIEMLLDDRRPRRAWAVASGVACLALLLAVAVAAQSDLAARRLQEEEVRALARAAARGNGFEVPVNDLVVRELNAVVGNPEIRRAFRAAIDRMGAHQPMIDRILERQGLPVELRAVPLVESRFQNLQESAATADYPGPRGAGLWMFIPPTARRYGLQVDGRVDQRLDPVRETEAAARFLAKLHGEFGDWGLALAAYNQGETAVRQAVEQAGTRDPWELIRQGRLNPYAGSVMAGVLVIAHPDLLRAP